MTALLLHVLSMSLTASVVILAVILARLPLRRAPKKISYWLWLAVAFRLCCPVSWNSPFSLFSVVPVQMNAEAVLTAEEEPSPAAVPEDLPSPASPALTEDDSVPVGISEDKSSGSVGPVGLSEANAPAPEPASEPSVGSASGTGSEPVLPPAGSVSAPAAPEPVPETPVVSPPKTQEESSAPTGGASGPVFAAEDETPPDEEPAIRETAPVSFLSRILSAAAVVWLCGIGGMLVYAFASYCSVRRAMATAIRLEDGVYESDRIRSPFLLGVVRPRIYLPFGTDGDMLRYVLSHERYHIRRGDSAVKLFAFLLLSVHWFNPLVWLAFALMTRDMEMSCDEYVLSTEPDIRKRYSYSLLSFASGRRFPSPSPLSFGEGDVKRRIKNVLGWKRPKRWVTVLAVVLALVAAVFCMANPMEKKAAEPGSTTEGGSAADSADRSVRSLTPLPEGDWQPLTSDDEKILLSSGMYARPILTGDESSRLFTSGWWNGWIMDGDMFRVLSIRLEPYAGTSFRWTVGEDGNAFVDLDYRGSYAVREDGTLAARFSPYDPLHYPDEPLRADTTYSAVFSVRYDAGHEYGTQVHETVGVTVLSTDCPEFLSLVGEEIAMTGATWFRGDLDGNPADAIRKMTPSDGAAALYEDAAAYEFAADRLGYGEALTALYPSAYDEGGNSRSDPDAAPAPDKVLVNVADLGDLCLYAENTGRLEGDDSDSFRLTAFRWRGAVYEPERPLPFRPYWFALSRADDFAFFTVWAPSGQNANVTYVFLTEDGAYCFDSADAEAGYQLRVLADEDGTAACIRTNADFLNLQEISMLYAFRSREDDPFTETGSLWYEDGRFVYAPDERLTGSEWFEVQKKTYPTSYPEETFGDMSFREYLSDFLPREIRDNTLRSKGLFTPEEAENVAACLIETMMHQDWLAEDFVFTGHDVSTFIMRLGMMQANAAHIRVPEALTKLWGGIDGSDGIYRANAYRVAREMFGLFPDDPSVFANEIFAYNEAKDCYEVVFPTGLPHGYFDYENMSTVWDDSSVTVRFRLVSYLYDPAEDSGHTNLSFYSDERIDFGEYRLSFYKTSGLYTNELPRIRFAKRGEIEADNTPEPPVSDEVKAAIVYPDFFDDEQRDLYARATVFFPAVWGSKASYVEDFAPRKDGEPFLNGYNYPSVTVYDPESGLDYRYFVCRGRYENWVDLDAAGRSLFTEEFWKSITGPGKRCMEYSGKTLFLDADAGGGGYDPALDRFELAEKTEEKITYWFITSYRARGTFEIESSERTLITLVKTDMGWRFSSFREGNWIPAGTDAPERNDFYTEDHVAFLVRDLVRHVMDDSWLADKTEYTALDAVRFVNTMPLWEDPYRVSEPSEDGLSVRVPETVCAKAVQKLFGIDRFDYFAAVREAYGDDISGSAERSGDGWLVWPTGAGEFTTKYDIAAVQAISDEAKTRVYVHLVNAADYPWEEADYGMFLFTFSLTAEGTPLGVRKVTRAEIERSIASLEGLRVQATNDMNNASAKEAEYDEEIARLRAAADDESALIEDRIAAKLRLDELETLRDQQIALGERCLGAIRQFAKEISQYEAVLAEMKASGIGILPEETVRSLYADLIEARYADGEYQPYAAELADLDGDDVKELIVFRTPTESTLPLDVYCIEDGEVRAFLSPFDVKKSEGAPDDDAALASLPADYAQVGDLIGFFRTEDGTVVLGAGVASEFNASFTYYQFASLGGTLRMRELFSAEWAGEWYFDEAKRNRTFVNGEEIPGGRDAYDAAVAAWITEFKGAHGPAERLASHSEDRWTIYNPDSRPPVAQAASWLRGTPDDALSDRLRGLTAQDLLYVTGTFSGITAEELAPVLNRTGTRKNEPEPGSFRGYYELEIYLSYASPAGGFGSGSETLTLFAGLQEDLVRITWTEYGSRNTTERFVRDPDLYRLLRENYRLTEQVDGYALEKWGQEVKKRAAETVGQSRGMDGSPVFTDYRIVTFLTADSFEQDGARYTVYQWSPVFLTDNPDNVVWAGGMYLDADERVCALEQETYWAIRETDSGCSGLFFDWGLFSGPDGEARVENERNTVVRAFEEKESIPVTSGLLSPEEQAEADRLHAKGLFSLWETRLIAEQLVTLTMRPEWLTDGDFRSAAVLFMRFGVSNSRYGSDYPAAFRSMIRSHDGNFGVSAADVRRLAVEFAGVPESEFRLSDYLSQITRYDSVNDEVFVEPTEGGRSAYDLEELTAEIRDDCTAARFTLYRMTYTDGYPKEVLERENLGAYEITFTAQGEGVLPRMNLAPAEKGYAFLTPMPEGKSVLMTDETAAILYQVEGIPPQNDAAIGSWTHWGVTADGHTIQSDLVFKTRETEQDPFHWHVYDSTAAQTILNLTGDFEAIGGGRFRATAHPLNDTDPANVREIVFSVRTVENYAYGLGEDDPLVIVLEAFDDERFAPYLGMRIPYSNYSSRLPSDPLSPEEQAETDALHAKGLFSRRETELVAEQLVTLTMRPEWLTDGDFRSATVLFMRFGVSNSRYGSDYPAAFRSMIRPHDGNFGVSAADVRRLAVEFAGVPESEFRLSDYLSQITRYDSVNDEVFVEPTEGGRSAYDLEDLTAEIRENGTAARFTLYRTTYTDGYPKEVLERENLGAYEITFTAQGEGVLPRMHLAPAAASGPSEARGAIPGNLAAGGRIAADAEGRIYFEDLEDRTLRRVNADGSDPVLLAAEHAQYINVFGGQVIYASDLDTIRRVPAKGGDPVTLWQAPSDSAYASVIERIIASPDGIWFGVRINGRDRVFHMNADGSDAREMIAGYTLEGVDGGFVYIADRYSGYPGCGLYRFDPADFEPTSPDLEQIWAGALYSAAVDEYGIAILVLQLERIVVLDRETFAEAYSTRYTYADYLWADGKLTLFGYTGEHGDRWVIRQTDVTTGDTRDILTLGEEIFDSAGRTFGVTVYDYYRSPDSEAVREAFAAAHPELADRNGEIWPLSEMPTELQAVSGEIWCHARSLKLLRETGVSDGWLVCDGADGRVARTGLPLSSDVLPLPIPYVLSPVFEESVTEGLYKREITILGFEGGSVHKDEINEFLRQGEAVRETYLNGVRDTEYPSPEWYDDWVLRISAGSAEAGDLLFLTVQTIRPSTYIERPQFDTLILERREDRLISLDEAVSALEFDIGAHTAAAEEAFIASLGGLRDDQVLKYFEFRGFVAHDGRLYERYEYDFYGVDFANDFLVFHEDPAPGFILHAGAGTVVSSLEELSKLGLEETDARLRYIRAFVTGDIDLLEQVCGVEKGMYAQYRTLELSHWAVWTDIGAGWQPLHFAFFPTKSDVEAFPADAWNEGIVSEHLIGAYFLSSKVSPSFGEAADELYELLSKYILLDFPTTDEMDYPTRFALSCYICYKLGNADLTEANFREYARKHFGIENFTPDGAHVGQHGGHGGSHQVLDVVGSEETDGETLVTVQYYADLSKTVKSHMYRYSMKRIDDGWVFTGGEEIGHSEYERYRLSM